jgi:hypothetical protein
MIKLRLKDGLRYVSIGTPVFTIMIKDGGANDPDGFTVDSEAYEKFLKPYAEPVPKKKKRRARIESLDLEE